MKRQLLVRMVLLLSFCVAACGFIWAGSICRTGSNGRCFGGCPREHPVCAKVGNTGNCACQGSAILRPFTEPREKEQTLVAEFTAKLVGAGGGPGWFDPGNYIVMFQDSAVSVEIQHSATWGSGTEYVDVPPGVLKLAIRIDSIDEENPNRRWFSITSLAATLPSFPSIALNGEPTGDSRFSDEPGQSAGWVDVTTGAFEVNVYSKFVNRVFCSDPAIVQGWFEGVVDPISERVTVYYDASSVKLISDSPREDPIF